MNNLSDKPVASNNSVGTEDEISISTLKTINSSKWQFSFFILAGLFIFFLIYTIYNDQRVTSLQTSIAETVRDEISSVNLQNLPNEATQFITNQLNYLESRQDTVINESKDALERMNFLFVIISAFFGLFTVFFGYRQITLEGKNSEASERYDQEMRNLVRSFQDNINTISSLIITLEKSYDYRREIQTELSKLNQTALELKTHKDQEDALYKLLVKELNAEAIEIFNFEIGRKALYKPDTKNRLAAFIEKLQKLAAREMTEMLNPFCAYLEGLAYLSAYRYEEAISKLQAAYGGAEQQLIEKNPDLFEIRYRLDLDALLNRLLFSSAFFQATSFRIIGKFKESIDAFNRAIVKDPDHIEAQVFLLETMYYDHRPFQEIERLYDATEERFTRLRSGGVKKFLFMLRGEMYIKKGLFINSNYSDYQQYENSEKAEEYTHRAYDVEATGRTAFSWAQALDGEINSSRPDRKSSQLYKEVLDRLDKRVREDDDHQYAVTLYYILFIAAAKLRMGQSEIYLKNVHDNLSKFPQEVRFFSPLSKVMLPGADIYDESTNFAQAIFENRRQA
jgi:tetratricopeptide (TPR) repeat protein